MSPKPLAFLLVAFAASGCVHLFDDSPRAKFIRLLREFEREFEASHAKPRPKALSPLQEKRRKELMALKAKGPRAFQLAKRALEDVESPNPAVRRVGLLALARCNEVGRTLLRFRAGFFHPQTPSDFDALLVKCDDPAVFHLRKEALFGEEKRRPDASRALDIFLHVKVEAILRWFRHAGMKMESPYYFEILAARDRALPALTAALMGNNPELAVLAMHALADIGTPRASRVLADAAGRPGKRIPTRPEVLEAMSRIDPASSVPVLAAFLSAGKPPDPHPVAWLIARKACPAHATLVREMGKSGDPGIRLAALAASARLGLDDPNPEIGALALGGTPKADPLPFLDFLREFPHLSPPFTPALCGLSRSRRVKVRILAARALAHVEGEESAKALREALIDSELPVRKAALEAMCRRLRDRREPGFLDGLRKCLRDKDASIRRASILGLGRARDRESLDDFFSIMEGEDPEEAAAALEAVSFFRSPELLGKVPLRLYWGKNHLSRRALVKALLMANDPGAETALHALIRLPDRRSKLLGISLLAPERARAVMTDLRKILSMTDSELKAAVIPLLSAVEDNSPAADPEPYLSSSDDGVRAASVRALARRENTYDRLLELSESVDPVFRKEALRMLAGAPDRRAARRLEAAVFEGDAALRMLGVRGLIRAGDSGSVPFLEFAAGDPDGGVRAEAARSLARVGGKKAVAILKGLTKDPNPLVQVATAAALESLGVPGPAAGVRKAIREGSLKTGPLARGKWLLLLGDFKEAAEAFQEGVRASDAPHGAHLEAARAWALALDGDRTLAALSQARALGFDDFDSLKEDRAFLGLLRDEGFSEQVLSLFRPSRPGEGFFHRFRGRVKLHLHNGSHLDAVLLAFRDERFVIEFPTGKSEIPKRQVARMERLE